MSNTNKGSWVLGYFNFLISNLMIMSKIFLNIKVCLQHALFHYSLRSDAQKKTPKSSLDRI